MFLRRHNYVTPWPIVLILICMSREGPYLPIDTKINFIGVWFGKSREGIATTPPPLVRRVTKNSLVRRGLTSSSTRDCFQKQNKTNKQKNVKEDINFLFCPTDVKSKRHQRQSYFELYFPLLNNRL